MADPLSLAAIIALACAGKKLSTQKETFVPNPPAPLSQEIDPNQMENPNEIFSTSTTQQGAPSFFGSRTGESKDVMESFADITQQNLFGLGGTEMDRLRERPYVSNRMDNLAPVQKQLVGPGLGVGPNVPAYGGYQQLYQTLPNNVGAYKLTTLPGRSGPAFQVGGGKPGLIGEITHRAPAKTAFLPSRYPNVARGRAQGKGGGPVTGMTYRSKEERTKRQTNRSETTKRCDGLEFNPAKSIVSALTLAEDPTRNKGDLTSGQFDFNNQPVPGISNFVGGYTDSPAVHLMEQNKGPNGYTAQQLEQFGFRPDDRRGKVDREGNAGRMNVRADPLNQGGMVTAVRADSHKYDGRLGPANGGWSQNYVADKYYQLNPYKGQVNTLATNKSLNIAKNQLANNPFAHTLA